MSYTKNCVRCFKPAKIWGGHVSKPDALYGERAVISGWCYRHLRVAEGNGPWFGHWVRKMGIVRKLKAHTPSNKEGAR